MIPSLVAAEVNAALRDFLSTGFSPSTPALADVMDEFLADSGKLAKGPYLSIALPFQEAPEGGEPFPEVPLGFIPYRHQRAAFSRLKNEVGRSTVIATGTGSGKTECFLYPILDYCRQQAGAKGIKAIIVYPMNALAADQARRVAAAIHSTPSIKNKVTAGLFIGQRDQSPATAMGPEQVITDRTVLRENPPDILLTNYKMLDFMLIRPRDQRLWRYNEPDTLRYLIVDELHTFDGAQGTDLACLIRRLRARGGVARERLICVGTSATMGAERGKEELLGYMRSIFDQDFDQDAVVGEVRKGIDEFLGSTLISGHLLPTPDLSVALDPAAYTDLEAYLRAQHELFFGEPLEGSFESPRWRLALAERLKAHITFVNLLRALEGRPKSLDEIAARLRRSLPVRDDEEALGVVNALCALISAARSEGDDERLRPFLRVSLHHWVRELRRMVCSVWEQSDGEDPEQGREESEAADTRPVHRLHHSDDLREPQGSVHLPLIQCRECHSTGWGAVKDPAESRVQQDLRGFYNRFFSRSIDVQYLFPGESPPAARGSRSGLCAKCGILNTADATRCTGCRSGRLVQVFRPSAVASRRRGERTVQALSRDCPYCGAAEGLIIVGARASSLLSVALGQTYASRYNDDHKVIAFSDNVQDAAHRAGFFAARTWQSLMRAAVAQVIGAHEGIALADLPDRVVAWWSAESVNPGALERERFVSQFIAPDRLWLRDFVALQEQGHLAEGSELPELVARRMRWETLAELGYRSAIGRTLERTRCAAVGVDRAAFARACDAALTDIREHIGGFRELDRERVRALLLGILRRMKDRGAIATKMTQRFIESGGDPWSLTRDLALQDFGPRSPLPVYPGERAGKSGIERFISERGSARSW